METRNCQNCKQNFTIEPDDFSFYEKMKVPAPTFCPECRMIRRLLWRNVRSLYKRECGLCHKILIAMFPDDGAPVYCTECFNGDSWDEFEYARDIDWSRDFFSQIYELLKVQPRVYQQRIGTVVNSDYGNSVVNCKNAYLCFSCIESEDILYSENIDRSRNSMDCYSVQEVEQSYWNIAANKNYNSHYLISSHSNIDSLFLFDCVNCQNCCLSSNLRNKQYYFMNQKMNKEEYFEAIKNLKLNTYTGFENAKREFKKIYENSIHKYANIISSQNAIGDLITNSKNIYQAFDVSDSSEDIRYSYRIIKSKELMDCGFVLTAELAYECSSPSNNTYNQKFSLFCLGSKNIEYSLFCKNCSDCFGCVGIKNAQYHILNKEYSKEEYFNLVAKIKEFMKTNPYIDNKRRTYSYGEFFPFDFSPFGYNETVTIDQYPITKEKAIEFLYPWKEREQREHNISLNGTDLPDSIEDTDQNILSEVIGCLNNGKSEYQCTTAYKITPEELSFYRQKGLPLPRYCPNCRHYERLKYRNPMKLYKRTCSNSCGREFDTTYSPDRPEKVYCEECYQREVL